MSTGARAQTPRSAALAENGASSGFSAAHELPPPPISDSLAPSTADINIEWATDPTFPVHPDESTHGFCSPDLEQSRPGELFHFKVIVHNLRTEKIR